MLYPKGLLHIKSLRKILKKSDLEVGVVWAVFEAKGAAVLEVRPELRCERQAGKHVGAGQSGKEDEGEGGTKHGVSTAAAAPKAGKKVMRQRIVGLTGKTSNNMTAAS